MDSKTRSATEVSGITAIAVAVSLIVAGQIVPGVAAFAIGVILIGMYEVLGIESVKLSEDEIERISERIEDVADSLEDDIRK